MRGEFQGEKMIRLRGIERIGNHPKLHGIEGCQRAEQTDLLGIDALDIFRGGVKHLADPFLRAIGDEAALGEDVLPINIHVRRSRKQPGHAHDGDVLVFWFD